MIYDPDGIPAGWPDVAAVVRIGREREVNGVNVSTVHDYLSRYAGTAAEFAGLSRGHWGIENSLHWALDVVFREDECRTTDTNAGANLSMLRKIAISLLKNSTVNGSIETRRLKAAWDEDLMLEILRGKMEV